jgi:hypothetical protein
MPRASVNVQILSVPILHNPENPSNPNGLSLEAAGPGESSLRNQGQALLHKSPEAPKFCLPLGKDGINMGKESPMASVPYPHSPCGARP